MIIKNAQRHPSAPVPYILLVALPGDSEVIDLIDELRQLGWSAVHAETPEMVAQAAPATIVVVGLSPSIEDTPIFAAIRHIDPHCLIPVLTEPMPIPDSPWTCSPIQIGMPLSQVARQIVDAICLSLSMD
jgi:hypothetical protein